MKMRWYDRILVSLSGVVLALVGVFIVLSGIGVVELPAYLAIDTWIGNGWQWMPIFFLVGLLFVAWGVHLCIRPVIGIRQSKSGKYYTVKTDDGDGVHISMQALDHLVHKCLERWPEVLTSQVRIGGQEDAMHITLRVTLVSDVRIPNLLAEVRAQIRQYIEECSGVTVDNVKIIVETTKDGTVTKEREIKLLKEAKPEEAPTAVEPLVEQPEPPFMAFDGEAPIEPQEVEEEEPEDEEAVDTEMEDADADDSEDAESIEEEDSDDAWS